MLLSDTAILRHMKYGSVVIKPFVQQRLNNASYDLSLGPWVVRYRQAKAGQNIVPHMSVDELFCEPFNSEPNGGFWLAPNERVLSHVNECAGGTIGTNEMGKKVAVNSSVHSTSTAQRIGVSVCLDAGWGDIGYCRTPYTLELLNHSPKPIFLPNGAIICQITFHETEVPLRTYEEQGSYSDGDKWEPSMMLPKTMKVAKTPSSPSERLYVL